MKIDPSKKYKTRDGRDVRILCTDMDESTQPVVGIIKGDELCHYWTLDGFSSPQKHETEFDLMEDREPREWELVVAKPGNDLYKAGTINGPATEELQGGDKRIPHEFWEIIRVREIIEP